MVSLAKRFVPQDVSIFIFYFFFKLGTLIATKSLEIVIIQAGAWSPAYKNSLLQTHDLVFKKYTKVSSLSMCLHKIYAQKQRDLSNWILIPAKPFASTELSNLNLLNIPILVLVRIIIKTFLICSKYFYSVVIYS